MDREMCNSFGQTPLFAGLDEGARGIVIEAGRKHVLDCGCSLWQQGDVPAIIAVVIDGQLKKTMIDAHGAQKTLQFMRRGDLAGAASMFGNFSRPTTLRATVATELLCWSADRFSGLMHVVPQLAINVLGIVGRQTDHLLRRLHEATSESADRRIARIVLRLVREGDPDGDCVPIELRISRQELAELSDTTLFTVSRTVSAWNRMQILKAGRGRLTVINPAGLADLAGDAPALQGKLRRV